MKQNPRKKFSGKIVTLAALALLAGAIFHRTGNHPTAAAADPLPGSARVPRADEARPAPRQTADGGTPSASPRDAGAPRSAAGTTIPAGTTAADSSGADSFPPRARALLEKIPARNATLRAELLSLSPDVLPRALRALAALPPSALADTSLHLAPVGALYYICALPTLPAASVSAAVGAAADVSSSATTTAIPLAAAASVPISQPPVRHSRPGSKNILLLDFSGLDIQNTYWNLADGTIPARPLYRAKPFDLDGDVTTFNATEQAAIIAIWERVAEDYTPFDVDITTEPIPAASFTKTTGRALITSATAANSYTMPYADTAAGVAYVNVFGEVNYHERVNTSSNPFIPDYLNAASPALIYYDKLQNASDKIAYAVSHELGHNLGLNHDGTGAPTTDTDGNPEYGYYEGHGTGALSWAPIMGAGYTRNVIQWSKGEYKNANNHEDDLAIIAGKLGYREETADTSPALADALAPAADGRLAATGALLHAGDAHLLALHLGGTGATVTATLAPFVPSDGITANAGNTDLRLEILDATGTATLASDNPASSTHAALTRALPAGQYLLRVSSTGYGNPLAASPTGFTTYGSIGQYTLTTNLVPSAPALDVALAASATAPRLWWDEGRMSGTSAAPWFGQAGVTHDNLHAAQSGSIASGTISSLATYVEGPGTLAFWWKTASHADDTLALVVHGMVGSAAPETIAGGPDNGNAANASMKPSAFVTSGPVPLAEISGSTGWLYQSITIPYTGRYEPLRVEWTFFKNSAGAGGAYLDEVSWMPDRTTFAPIPARLSIGSGTGSLTLDIDTNTDWLAGAAADWLAISPNSGTGAATLTVSYDANSLPLARSGTIVIWADDFTLLRTTTVTQAFALPLATALDTPGLDWTIGGDNGWFGQKQTSSDGLHAARSGITHGDSESWMQTTVTGTGVVGFWWKVSSEQENTTPGEEAMDGLYFYVDGQERARISGAESWAAGSADATGWRLFVDDAEQTPPSAAGEGWDRRKFAITTPGTHTLKWSYKKDFYWSVGSDAGWVDQVVWPDGAAALSIAPESQSVPSSGGTFTLIVASNSAWSATAGATWLTVTQPTGSGNGAITVTYAANNTTSARNGSIVVTSGDTTRTCQVTQAAAGNTGDNGNNNNGGNSGGGGGAASLWWMAALVLLLGVRSREKSGCRRAC